MGVVGQNLGSWEGSWLGATSTDPNRLVGTAGGSSSASGTLTALGASTETTNQAAFGGGKRKQYQFTPFNPGRLQAELAQQQARNAIQEAFAKAVEDSTKKAEKPVKTIPSVSFTATDLPGPMAEKLAADLAAYEKFADDLQKATIKKMALEDEEAFAILLIAIEA